MAAVTSRHTHRLGRTALQPHRASPVAVARSVPRCLVAPGLFVRPGRSAHIQLCYSSSSSSYSGEPWQQWRTDQSLEQLLEPYGVRTVQSISNHPEHADMLETLVVLASILHPENDEVIHEIIEEYPELADVPPAVLLRAFNALEDCPDCYSDLDIILLAARTIRILPLSQMHKVTRLAQVYYDVLNSTLPNCLVYMLGPTTSFSRLCHRIRRLATLLRPHAALAAIEQHPQLLDYEPEDLEQRLRLLEKNLNITQEQAAKAAGKAPGILMLTTAILYYRMDALAERFTLTFDDMKDLFLAEPRVLVQDLDVLSAKWKALMQLATQLPEWDAEVAQQRPAFLVQLARCNVVMLQKMAYEFTGGARITGDCTLLDLLYLERQYWRSKSAPPQPPPRRVPEPDSDDEEED